jgi:TetR/AcrR family fatty acid metabolism transcriptional regulator
MGRPRKNPKTVKVIKTAKTVRGGMKKTGRKSQKWYNILKAAETTFAEKGFHDTTISEIARLANASEATIYEYFESKEELLFTIPIDFTRKFLDETDYIMRYVKGAENKLRALIHHRIDQMVTNERYAQITTSILKSNRNFLKTEAYRLVQKSARNWTKVLQEGIDNGEFRPEIKTYIVRAMIWGTIEHLVIRKAVLGEPKDMSEYLEDIIDVIIKGIKVEKPDQKVIFNFNMNEKEMTG